MTPLNSRGKALISLSFSWATFGFSWASSAACFGIDTTDRTAV